VPRRRGKERNREEKRIKMRRPGFFLTSHPKTEEGSAGGGTGETGKKEEGRRGGGILWNNPPRACLGKGGETWRPEVLIKRRRGGEKNGVVVRKFADGEKGKGGGGAEETPPVPCLEP